MSSRPLKTIHLRRWCAPALAAAYPKYASLGGSRAALHLDRFERPASSLDKRTEDDQQQGSFGLAARIGRRIVGLAAIALAVCLPGVSAAADTAEYRLALPGYTFSFPRDHYAHDDFRTEWWYYTGHLHAGSGERYGYQVTFFRSGLAGARSQPSRWAARNLYLAHFAVSDVTRKRFQFFERIGRAGLGQAGADETALHAWLGGWEVSGAGTAQRLRAQDGDVAVDLRLVSQKPPARHGENGVSRKGEGRGQASHYYSLTRLATEGTLSLPGRTMPVTGLSWMDHEFGSTRLGADQVGWDWFSLQFDDGTELMLYSIRTGGGQTDPYSSGTWVARDGRTVHLKQTDFAIDILDRWTSPRTKATYPTRWRLRAASIGVDVTVAAAFPDQELDTRKSTRVIYWEGAVTATGTSAGHPATAQGYVEMTGYAAPFRQRL